MKILNEYYRDQSLRKNELIEIFQKSKFLKQKQGGLIA